MPFGHVQEGEHHATDAVVRRSIGQESSEEKPPVDAATSRSMSVSCLQYPRGIRQQVRVTQAVPQVRERAPHVRWDEAEQADCGGVMRMM